MIKNLGGKTNINCGRLHLCAPDIINNHQNYLCRKGKFYYCKYLQAMCLLYINLEVKFSVNINLVFRTLLYEVA